MKKGVKAQISIFVIIAIIVVAAAAGLVFLDSQSTKNDLAYFTSLAIKPDFDQAQARILTCYDMSARGALDTIGIQGGYYEDARFKQDLENEYEGVFVPYYYHEGEITIPSREDIERNMEQYVEDYLPLCIEDITVEGFTFTHQKARAFVSIQEEGVTFDTGARVTIKKDGHAVVFELSDYPLTKKSALSAIYDLAFFITDSHTIDPQLYCISCVDEIATEHNLYVETTNLADFTTLTIISENHTSSEPYSYMFLNKYTGREESTVLV